MHKFKVDSSIVEEFLKGSNLKKFQDEEIYLIGDEDQPTSIFTMPINPNYDRITLLMKRLVNVLKYFTMPNENKYYMFLKNIDHLEEKIIVRLVVGMPKRFTKLFRSTSDGQNNIIIDLANYTLYSDDYDEIVEDIEDYLGYALTLLVLDSQESKNIKTSINTFEHALYCTSFANYISESNQLNFMRNLNMLEMWIFLEYDTLKRVVKEKKHSSRYALEYLDMSLASNPEMIALGVTGKVFLEDKNTEEVSRLFDLGPNKFMEKIAEDKELRFVSKMTKSLSFIKYLIIPIVCLWVISVLIFLGQEKLFIWIKILPFIIMFLLTLQEVIKYKLSYISNLMLVFKIGLYIISSIIFCGILR